MTVRYFEPVDVPDRLVRVDLDPRHTVAQRLDPTGWVDVPALYKILLLGDNLGWNELAPNAAAERAKEVRSKNVRA